MKKLLLSLLCVGLLFGISGCSTTRGFPPVANINNFDDVTSHLCRGAQENVDGIKFLKAHGVDLVINLREPSDTWPREEAVCEQAGIYYINLPEPGFGAPDPQRMELAVELIDYVAAHGGKTFVHCQWGCDRTGTLVACYEIRHGVPNDVAQKEANFYGMSPFEVAMKDFIKKFK